MTSQHKLCPNNAVTVHSIVKYPKYKMILCLIVSYDTVLCKLFQTASIHIAV